MEETDPKFSSDFSPSLIHLAVLDKVLVRKRKKYHITYV